MTTAVNEKVDVDLDETIEEPCDCRCQNAATWRIYIKAEHSCNGIKHTLLLCDRHYQDYASGVECMKCLAPGTITHTERIR